MKVKQLFALFLFLGIPILAIYIIGFAPAVLLHDSYHDMQTSYIVDLSLAVQFSVGVYFVYTRCYLDKCVGFRSYLKREKKANKDQGDFSRYIGTPFVMTLAISIPFIMSFLAFNILLLTYLHLYTFFNHEEVMTYMYMQPVQTKHGVKASPNDKYKLHGNLESFGLSKKNMPYLLVEKKEGLTTKYIPEEGYMYQIWAQENKYGYFVKNDQYLRVRHLEYSRKQLVEMGCKMKDWKFNCDDIQVR